MTPGRPDPDRTGSGRPLLWFIGRRIFASLLVLFGITLIAFVLTQLVPADAAVANLGQNATQEQIDNFNEVHGLNDPLPVQYGRYLVNLLHGDLGVSQQTHNPVTTDLKSFVPATAELALAVGGHCRVVRGPASACWPRCTGTARPTISCAWCR